jgi:hypothetical protein
MGEPVVMGGEELRGFGPPADEYANRCRMQDGELPQLQEAAIRYAHENMAVARIVRGWVGLG